MKKKHKKEKIKRENTTTKKETKILSTPMPHVCDSCLKKIVKNINIVHNDVQ